ncbi:MAG: hypothetical protein HDS68_02030 [Bacteroidales bacterium]|nr:hypothetical protein [Bacteroidales bacterium]
MVTLKYKDEEDRAYGLGGMVVSMYMLDNDKYIDSISLDAESDHGLRFTADFFHLPNPNLSPKAVWSDSLDRFNLLNSLLVSNLLSRSLVRRNERVSREIYQLLMDMLIDEGRELCSLDEDEIKQLYNKNFSYFHEVFSNDTVAETVRGIVDTLKRDRSLDNDALYICMRPMRR